jgi:hypothetical protein
MGAAINLNTARGSYRLTLVEQTEVGADPWTLTLSAEHAGGLEKFAFRCRIAAGVLGKTAIVDASDACARVARWMEGQFEQIREAALKSIRSERRLAEFEFDELRPGPFTS